MGQKQTATDIPAQTFETAIERLEQIVEQMEGDKLPLEQLLAQYEEGSKLVKVCQERLEAAERRVEIIARGAAGKVQAIPFDAESAAAAPAPASTPAPAAKKPVAAGEVSLF